jgi:glutathione synthase/RimK-type ligase-like ATP-grasp enzyme
MHVSENPTIYVIHENDAWLVPLREAFKELGQDFVEWHFGNGDTFDFSEEPPKGIFYNRMSASSHTRDHRFAAEHTHAVLEWLDLHERRVVNNSRALALEISKVRQYAALQKHGIKVPRTAIGSYDFNHHTKNKQNLLEIARKTFGDSKFITKHNRSGKGLGVHLFQNISGLGAYLESDSILKSDEERPVDGVLLLQEYIQAPQPEIFRAEFVGGEFQYIVRIDTSKGFELCPADQCNLECPIKSRPGFEIKKDEEIEEDEWSLIGNIGRFLKNNGIEIAGVEYIRDRDSNKLLVYDVNTNTNYNPMAERNAGKRNMLKIAEFLTEELHKLN